MCANMSHVKSHDVVADSVKVAITSPVCIAVEPSTSRNRSCQMVLDQVGVRDKMTGTGKTLKRIKHTKTLKK